MATVEELRARIASMEELRGLVRIMRAMAAVKARSFSGAVASSRLYTDVVSDAMQVLVRELPAGFQPEAGGQGAGVLVALGSDQGLCGGFNRRAAARARELAAEGPRLVVVGLRLAGELEDAGVTIEEAHHLPVSLEGVAAAGQELVTRVDALRRRVDAAWVRVVHNRPVGAMGYETTDRLLMPFDPEWLRAEARRPWPTRCLPMHFGSPEQLLSELVRQHLFVALFRAFAESMAAENSARLGAMEAATRNVEERLDQLTLDFHGARQGAITEELLDVTAGYEAMGG